LLRFLNIYDPGAEAIIGGIIKSTILDVVDEVLREAGIIEVPGFNRPLEGMMATQSSRRTTESESMSAKSHQSAGLTTAQSESPPPATATRPSSTGHAESYTETASAHERQRASNASFSSNSSDSISTPFPAFSADRVPSRAPITPIPYRFHSGTSDRPDAPAETYTGIDQYAALLDRIIKAGSEAKFPTHGAFNLDGIWNALPTDPDAHITASFAQPSLSSPFGVRSQNQLSHDMKIGAAGELYVSRPTRSIFTLFNRADHTGFW
jgi:hypothetical protein